MKSRTMQWVFHIVTISYSNSSCSALSMTINLVCVEVPYCFNFMYVLYKGSRQLYTYICGLFALDPHSKLRDIDGDSLVLS